MPQPPTISETRASLKKMEDDELARKREINARLRQQAENAQKAQKNAPKIQQPEPKEETSTSTPESSEEEEIRKTFHYLKK